MSMPDARALAPNLHTTSDFILAQPKLSFAAHIRGATLQAVSVPVPEGELEDEPRLLERAYERLMELNRKCVSLPPLSKPVVRKRDEIAGDVANQDRDDDLTEAREWR